MNIFTKGWIFPSGDARKSLVFLFFGKKEIKTAQSFKRASNRTVVLKIISPDQR